MHPLLWHTAHGRRALLRAATSQPPSIYARRTQYLEPQGQLPLEEAAAGAGRGAGGLRGVMVLARATVENAQLVAAQVRSARARCADPIN